MAKKATVARRRSGRKREYVDTTVSLAPLTVDEALAALLKTPPPPDEQPKKSAAKKRGTKKR